MSRRSVFVAVGIVVFLTCSVGTALVLLLHYEPGHHRRCVVPPGEERIQNSRTFTREFFDLLSAMSGKDPWSKSFTAEQINSYLAEGFVHSGLSERLLPEGVSEPHVLFEVDRLRLSFRYRSGLINTIVSITMHVWLPRNETNIVAVGLEAFQAGLLPCKAQWLLERISEVARQNAIDVSWYRHEGTPVAILRFQADQPRPTLQLTGVQIADGIILVSGQASELKVEAPAGPVRLALHEE
jgi:hypothetical protein